MKAIKVLGVIGIVFGAVGLMSVNMLLNDNNYYSAAGWGILMAICLLGLSIVAVATAKNP